MTQRNQSKITTEFKVDDPLQQRARFEMDADDRQYIDNQIRGTQARVIALAEEGISGVVEVEGDVARSGGDGTPIDRVLGQKGVAFEPADTLGKGEVWLKRGGGTKLRAGRPVLPGWYDPLDYGCPWDGIHDDLPGLTAMMADMTGSGPKVVHLPPGLGYCSDNLRVKRAVTFRGHGGGYDDANGVAVNGISFPPLKGVIFESYYTTDDYPVSTGATGVRLENVSLVSKICIVTRNALGHGVNAKMMDPAVDIRVPSTYYALGRVVINAGYAGDVGVDGDGFAEGATRTGPTIMFRCTTAGTVTGSAPASFATKTVDDIGDTITDSGGVTWIVESIPKDYLNDTDYVLGERVYLPGDTQAYFECIEAGHSAVAGVNAYEANGIGVSCPAVMVGPAYGSEFYDDGGAGPGLKWKAYFPAGVLVLAPNCMVSDCTVSGFTGYGYHVNSNLDDNVYATVFGFADFPYIKDTIIAFCGGGMRYNGSDGGGGSSFNTNHLFLGMGRTNVDAAAYLNTGGDVWGSGAAGILDRALGGNTHIKSYLQFCLAAPWRNDSLAGSGSPARFEGCVAETSHKAFFLGYPVVIGCIPTNLTGAGIIIGASGRGIQEEDHTPKHTSVVYAKISNTTGGLHAFRATEDLNNEWGWQYEAGYWRLRYGGTGPISNAFTISSFGAGVDPGSGWLTLERGHFSGDVIGSALFRGPLAGDGSAVGRIKDRNLRSGLRLTGDRFEGATGAVTITSDGYRGEPWTALTAGISEGYAPVALPPYIVEPTANGAWPAAGGSVWKATVGGTTGAIEPDWSTALPDGGTSIGDVYEGDGDVTWELIGFTPHYDVEQRTDKTTIPTRLSKKQTTTATASQVIENGGVVGTVDLALPPGSMVLITDLITLKKAASADGGTIKVESTWVRNGAGAPAQIGTTIITYNLSGATLDGTTVAHVANGNRIELQGSPESADALSWRVFRTQATGED